MFVECLDEVRVSHDGREYLFEERKQFGYIYEVADELGTAAIATGKCRAVKDYQGPVELPSSKLIV